MSTDEKLELTLAKEALQKLLESGLPLSTAATVVYQLASLLGDAPATKRAQQAIIETANLEGEAASIRTELAHPNANPYQGIARGGMRAKEMLIVSSLANTRAWLTEYATAAQKQLRFSQLGTNLFERTRARVDDIVRERFADAAASFAIAYEQLDSENSENWSLAATACRRLLKAIADRVFPSRVEPRVKDIGGGKTKKFDLTDDKYRNRLVAFVEDHSSSETFARITGSHLQLLIDRLEAIDESLNKGVHSKITRDEADSYVLFTYLIVGDILTLLPKHQ